MLYANKKINKDAFSTLIILSIVKANISDETNIKKIAIKLLKDGKIQQLVKAPEC